ncbi:N6-L-threonylcarbamoyladenine synthase [Orenia metallireducens]|uniref:N(6)-L-threonylcarbamoyladenine synthase n=1 Tax=Orenia metallireducens TaxID=1413210 RepID=A0A285HLG6_9FIRM|nr:O-sialoglycoprotein endopeptidase [Orenia metallireducens]SNY36579.1 N6-L-threonylcarbamoyladenine synthase [Orenia metallireducens]
MILGIDTSNYTTSVALMTLEGKLVKQKRERLKVDLGERGLRQSEALFQHVEQLPALIAEVAEARKDKLTKIIVSTKPRPQEGSYMPVFKVGFGHAKALASILDIPLIETSHQEGHLMAGLWSAKINLHNFLAVHLSGGTSEILKVEQSNKHFDIQELGASQDLHAGQFIDRVGVALGLSFPAGPQLESLATKGELGKVSIPSSVQGYQMSFSGPASAAMRLIKTDKASADIALAVQQCIANSLEKVLKKAIVEEKSKDILIVGGVAANQYIRERLKKRLEHPAVGAKLYFADPKWSSDNAVGVAAMGVEYRG